MDAEIAQLVDMGATPAQARAALRKVKDVMDAAELIFSGEIDVGDDMDEGDARTSDPPSAAPRDPRPITPADDNDAGSDVDQEMADGSEDDEEEEAYQDYDSDYETKIHAKKDGAAVDPYAGIFFAKTRKETVVEVDEDPEFAMHGGVKYSVMSQGDWMRGCPEAAEQSHLFSLYNKTCEPSRKCPACATPVPMSKAEFLTIYPSFAQYTEVLRSTVVRNCPNCQQELCIACGEMVHQSDKTRPAHMPKYDPLFHCSDLQGLLLGMGLYMIDRVYAEEIYGTTNDDELIGRPVPKKRKVDEDAPDSNRSGKKKSGTGYDGQVREDTSGQAEAAAAQLARDNRIGTLMSQVRVYLPSLQREGGSQATDYLVSPTALAHLRRRFNTVASHLLRNDSLTDMSDRSVLYFELFSWLQTISNHEALASMVAMPIMIPSSSTVVNSPPSSTGRRYRERTVVYEGSSGPRELMESLVIQAVAAKKGLEGSQAEANKPVDPDEMTEEQKRITNVTRNDKGKGKEKGTTSEENAKLLNFCDRIIATAAAIDRSLRETKGDAFVERMYSSLPRIPAKARPNNGDASASRDGEFPDSGAPMLADDASEADAQKAYEEWATTVRFEYCDLSIVPTQAALEARSRRADEPVINNAANPDDIPSYMSAFNQEARMLTHSDIPKRNLAIAKELAVLTTNLPVAWGSSVFLRVDETRVDIIKALITGPEGTPYYNGCYCFDIFLGPSYNTSPPSVKYMTTNAGKFRFNPNLYADGKVCLSLLGTWSGPGWVAGKSTLLQVLISIQSMILCDEPYLNEPGWANSAGTAASAAYSANVRRMVVHTAMLGNLKNPPEPWKDIILTHFRLKAKSITKQLDDWLKLDDGKQLSGIGAAYVGGPSSPSVGGSTGNGFRRDVDELKGLLAGLSRGEDPTARAGGSSGSIPTPNATAAQSQTNLAASDD